MRRSRGYCLNGALPQKLIPILRGALASPRACSCFMTPAFRRTGDFFKNATGHDCVLALVMARTHSSHEPGKQIEYSDLGFILLGEIVQRLTGEFARRFRAKGIFAPLGMKASLFNPPRALRASIPPTEDDLTLSQAPDSGEVARRKRMGHGRSRGPRGFVFNGRRYRRLRADASERRYLRASPHRLARDDLTNSPPARRLAIPRARSAGTCPVPAASGRYFSPRAFGHYRIYRHVPVDRSRTRISSSSC